MKKETKIQIVKDVQDDFEVRRIVRRPLELQWQLNIDFLRGNQNNYITSFDSVAAMGARYHWQKREVFNHISTLVETRLGKLADNKEQLTVVPLSSTERDIQCAEKCEKIIKSAFKKVNMAALADQANMWSEMTGSAFYKIVWENNGGKVLGYLNHPVTASPCHPSKEVSKYLSANYKEVLDTSEKEAKSPNCLRESTRGAFEGGEVVFEGDVRVVVCSPFEIYPDSLTAGDVNEAGSIIHAKPYSTQAIRRIWGVDVAGNDVEVFDFNRTNKHGTGVLKNAAMVIERYKDGRLTIVAGDKLLFDGEYNQMPFVRQTSESLPGSFFGKSVIERAIPVQRAYNTVKNRKTEFLNRLACGVLAVEENSTDIEALENDGLAPGTIITYKSGMKAPVFLDGGSVPAELEREEERLLNEMAVITGGSSFVRGEGSLSGVALEILVEQDRLRIRRAIVSAQNAAINVASHILRLYKRYGGERRLDRLASGRCVELFTWSADDITSDEVVTTPSSA